MAKNSGWVPQQHGAWAMLITPMLLGVILRLSTTKSWHIRSESSWYLIPLCATMFLGYFAFNAAALWLKAAAKRRHIYVRPTVTWAIITAICGILTIILAGVPIIGWALVFLPLTAIALFLVKQGKERSLTSGAVTVIAASLFLLPCVCPEPTRFFSDALPSDSYRALASVLLCCSYFIGTIFSVKTLIRERRSNSWWTASVGYHIIITLVTLVICCFGKLAWVWPIFFAATTVRAWLLPWLNRRGRQFKPSHIGRIEMAFTLAFIIFLILLATS
ncbi:MAG: YwiC-like family protein [Propionibacteriaceae bacterium]